jgi:hypothetical protein
MGSPIFLFDNRFADGDIMTPEAMPWGGHRWASYPWGGGLPHADYLTDNRSSIAWESQDTGAQTIVVRCGTPKPASCLGVAGHNLKSAGCRIAVEGSSDNFKSVITSVLPEFTPYSDQDLMIPFSRAQHCDWRLRLTPGGTAARIGEICLGVPVVMPVAPDTPFTPRETGIQAETNESRQGQFLGAIIHFYPVSLSMRFSILDRSWAFGGWGEFSWGGKAWGDGALLPALWNHLKTLRPLFFAWDLDNYPADVLYARAKPGMIYKTPLSVLQYLDSFEVQLESIG